jgi:hypothetical protein
LCTVSQCSVHAPTRRVTTARVGAQTENTEQTAAMGPGAERQRPQVSSLLVTYLVYLYMHIQRTYSASCSTQSRHSTRQTRVEYCNSTLSTCRPYLRLDTSDSTPRGATHDTGRGPEGTRPHDEIKVTLTAALASKLGREFLLVTRLCTLHSLLSDRLAVYCRRVLDRRAS